ncbi:phospholipase D-like domain-containing protein [Candidatus Neptunochlamydia vexilliferae]|uniref:phospholipase D-like domain-containing protein n=1 Tax=Candidatus Neptunichlamydia vexilliferae TaxID=1651774 RepID=UPI001891D2FA|nr:phospholipase D-like domain-containing protein [Candidatus Neptunochlamydia vexilliferae]
MPALLCAGLVFYATWVPLPTEKTPFHLYSTDKRDDLKKTLLSALKRAKHSITLHTYALTDQAVLSLLKKKGEKGMLVHLYYHKKASPELETLEWKNVHFHPIKGRGLMHEKIWIIDQKTLFLGSANLTTSSLKMHDNLMVGLYAPALAEALSQKRVEERVLEVGGRSLHYFSLPSQKGLEALLEALDQGEREVSAALFTFTHPLLVKKLIELHERGVKVSLTLDRTTSHGASKKALEALEEAGIRVKISSGLQLCHHKWAQIDQKILIIGSANWTAAAFEKNRDFILIIKMK